MKVRILKLLSDMNIYTPKNNNYTMYSIKAKVLNLNTKQETECILKCFRQDHSQRYKENEILNGEFENDKYTSELTFVLDKEKTSLLNADEFKIFAHQMWDFTKELTNDETLRVELFSKILGVGSVWVDKDYYKQKEEIIY